MPTPDVKALSQQAQFVFKGTVRKLKATTMPEIAADARTAVVKVDEVVQAPAVLSKYAGQEITVQMAGTKKTVPGEHAIFYTTGWRFGDGLAVKSLDQLPIAAAEETVVAPAMRAMARARPAPESRLADAKMQKRIASSDVILSGRVVDVRLAPETEATVPPVRARRFAAAAAGTIDRPRRISEHDPLWHEAVVQVGKVEKGSAKSKHIVVRFPGSHDVRWYKAPKFKPGQEGVFMLRKGAAPARATRAVGMAGAPVGAAAPDTYLVTSPEAFHPIERIDDVRNFLSTTPAQPRKAVRSTAAPKKTQPKPWRAKARKARR